jgi:prevent-host-death family protein
MVSRLPEIRPITDLARDARGLVERARQHQEPIIITQRGRDAAVLLPIELYRRLEQQLAPKIMSPRLARPEDADRLRMEMEVVSTAPEMSDAGV